VGTRQAVEIALFTDMLQGWWLEMTSKRTNHQSPQAKLGMGRTTSTYNWAQSHERLGRGARSEGWYDQVLARSQKPL